MMTRARANLQPAPILCMPTATDQKYERSTHPAPHTKRLFRFAKHRGVSCALGRICVLLTPLWKKEKCTRIGYQRGYPLATAKTSGRKWERERGTHKHANYTAKSNRQTFMKESQDSPFPQDPRLHQGGMTEGQSAARLTYPHAGASRER